MIYAPLGLGPSHRATRSVCHGASWRSTRRMRVLTLLVTIAAPSSRLLVDAFHCCRNGALERESSLAFAFHMRHVRRKALHRAAPGRVASLHGAVEETSQYQ
jgi:hypothetical protein